ncbi:MAG: hypothetical protein WC331_06545 [Candidatus Omnitrophota bacterium]|jgi:hypothetical protein
MSKKLTPLKAIRAKCLDCSCFQPKEVKLCTIPECALFPFRQGRNPSRAGIGGRKPELTQKSACELGNSTNMEAANG